MRERCVSGRTGTIIAAEYVQQSILKGDMEPLKEVLKKLRNQRASVVQTAGSSLRVTVVSGATVHLKTSL